MSSQKKVAVVLCGCGVYDGCEVHEASSCLVHLSRKGSDVKMFAPDMPQMHVINHLTGKEQKETRNVLVESARIARGSVQPLSKLSADEFDALVVPGGFGAAKNLSDFAVKGAECSVQPDVQRALLAFHSAGKPVGLCCIAPTLVAKLVPKCEITMGHEAEGERWPHAGATQAAKALGATHVAKEVTESHVDKANKIVTTPAYMCNAPVHQIYEGVGSMIDELLKLA